MAQVTTLLTRAGIALNIAAIFNNISNFCDMLENERGSD